MLITNLAKYFLMALGLISFSISTAMAQSDFAQEAAKEAETKKAAESVTKPKEFDENDINTFPEQLVDFLKTEFKEAEDLNTTGGRTFDEWLKDDAQIGIIRYFMKELKGELKEEPVVEKVEEKEEEGKTKEENIEKIISSEIEKWGILIKMAGATAN